MESYWGHNALLLYMYSSLETTVTIKETLHVYQPRNDHYKLLSHEAECCNDYKSFLVLIKEIRLQLDSCAVNCLLCNTYVCFGNEVLLFL